MKRRDFIKRTAILAAATSVGNIAKAKEQGQIEVQNPQQSEKLIISAPMLQNYAEESMGVAFAVSALANGYVLYGERPDLSDAKKVKCGGYRTA